MKQLYSISKWSFRSSYLYRTSVAVAQLTANRLQQAGYNWVAQLTYAWKP